MRFLLLFAGFLFYLISTVTVSQTLTGCNPGSGTTDTIAPPPPPPPPVLPDTVTLIRKLEEFYISGNPNQETRVRTFSFYYDNQKRVTAIGLRNHSSFQTDTMTTRMFYTGNEKFPRIIITPSTASVTTGPALYDTCWISTGSNGRPVKDSATDWSYNSTTGQVEHVFPVVRNYTYNGNQTYIEWRGRYHSNVTGFETLRLDTIISTADTLITWANSVFYTSQAWMGSPNTITQASLGSSYLNPLAQLNFSGTFYSLIYTPAVYEILGNRFHIAAHNSNTLAYYLDFYNNKIPARYFMSSYLGSFLLAAGGIQVDITVTPWATRPVYPAELFVTMSFGYPGDKFRYKYTY